MVNNIVTCRRKCESDEECFIWQVIGRTHWHAIDSMLNIEPNIEHEWLCSLGNNATAEKVVPNEFSSIPIDIVTGGTYCGTIHDKTLALIGMNDTPKYFDVHSINLC